MKFTAFAPLKLIFALIALLAADNALHASHPVGSRQFFDSRATGGTGIFWSVAQDARGVMYFGCDQLISYDGERWQRHNLGSTYEVRSIAIGSEGRVWIGAMNDLGYLDRTETGALGPFHSLRDQLPNGIKDLAEVWNVFVQGNRVVFVTESLVLIWNGTTFTHRELNGARRLVGIQTEEGEIFISHRPSGLYRLVGDELKLFLSSSELGDAGISGLERRGDSWLIVGTSGLARYTNGHVEPLESSASAFIRNTVLWSVSRLHGGKIGVGTKAGVLVLSPSGELERLFGPDDGVPLPGGYSIHGSARGEIWITLATGIARIGFDHGSTFFSRDEGLAGKPCSNVADVSGKIFVGTARGVFELRKEANGGERFHLLPSTSDQKVHELTGNEDRLYVGTMGGVFRLSDGLSEKITPARQDVVLLRPTQRPGILFAVDQSRLLRLDLRQPSSPQAIATLPEVPLSLAEDPSENIWAGMTIHGVLLIRPNGPVTRLNSPAARAERCLVARLHDRMIVCSTDGIAVFSPNSSEFTVVDGAPHSTPIAISNTDAESRVWIAFSSPFANEPAVPLIGRLQLAQNGDARWEPFAAEGLEQLGKINGISTDSAGSVWIAGADGALRLEPHTLQAVETPSTPLVTANIARNSKLPYKGSPIMFELATTEYARRSALRFQTKLAGLADNWSAPTNSARVELTGLRDGGYEFSARVINDAGLTSAPTTWSFRVLPPWYRTKTAYGAWTALLAAAVFGLVQWRSSYLRQQNLRLEALVRKKTEQLEQANQAKTDFIADMSHEIRNPISGIVGLSLAMEETSLDERQRQLTDSIRSCASLLATLVDDVLDFSKIEAGKIDLRLAPFEVRSTLEQCAAMVAEDVRRAGAELTIEVETEVPPRLVGDAARIQQILLNYLTNAVKFASAGAIVVGASRISPERIRFFVRDQGPGMSDADAAQLFTKFARLEKARANNVRGSGLGLAVCRLLADKMGGSVGVNSKIGHGSCFWAELPLPVAAEQPIRTPTPAPSGPPLRALIVEDIDYNAAAMQAVLRKLGVQSDVVTDGPSALEQLQRTFYDVAFMDWNLPGMIGTEVVSRFRTVESPQRRTIIIATTAYSAEFNREACLQAGMDAFIGKPLTPEKIAAALRDLRGSLRSAISVELSTQPLSSKPAASTNGQIDLHMLRFLGDNTPEGLREQITRYLESFEKDRETASAAMKSGDAQAIHRIAHRLASHASMVRYEPLRELAATLQSRAASSKREELTELFAAFDREFEAFRKKLDSIRSSAGSA